MEPLHARDRVRRLLVDAVMLGELLNREKGAVWKMQDAF